MCWCRVVREIEQLRFSVNSCELRKQMMSKVVLVMRRCGACPEMCLCPVVV